jgi:hypothetical protein
MRYSFVPLVPSSRAWVLLVRRHRVTLVFAVPPLHRFTIVMIAAELSALMFMPVVFPAGAVVIPRWLVSFHAPVIVVVIAFVALGRSGRRCQADRQS